MKKIRLDFSKVEERSGWNTRAMPEGIHKFKIVSVQEQEAQDGTDMLVYALVPADSKYKTRNFPFYCKLQQNQLWKLRDLLIAAGQTVPKKATQIDPSVVVGKYIAAEVSDATGQYAGRSEIQGTYPLDILDDDGNSSADDDEDDEYEGDEDEADEAEDEDEDEDDEADDLESLTLPELRARAKALGIATSGLKKDDLIDEITDAEADSQEDEDEDDDDDLDDEDLDDDELYEDDEDDEPAPAPKRRSAPAAKAPARKPAPKAAPAKRVVKRR